ncbi:MAG: isocitrate/isopropylmalate family dehydrogenase [Panacagrimonas sp.]
MRDALGAPAAGRDLIGVLPGEGIGPEVIAVALEVLETLSAATGRRFDIRHGGAIGKESIRLNGAALSEETVAFCDAIFTEGGALLCGPGSERFVYELRRRFDLFAKFTPLQPLPCLRERGPLRAERLDGVDILAVRENVGGLYFGEWGRKGESAFHRFDYSVQQVDRILALALRLAERRSGRLCLAVKREGVPSISQLWLERLEHCSRDPAVHCEVLDIDNAAYQLIADPRRFDVLVSSNMFGDLLADTGSALLGSRGLSYSGNFGPQGRACYQTGHGAAWDLAGRDMANPVGQVLSLALMLEVSFGWSVGAEAVRAAVARVFGRGLRTADIAEPHVTALSTRELGAQLCQALGSPVID